MPPRPGLARFYRRLSGEITETRAVRFRVPRRYTRAAPGGPSRVVFYTVSHILLIVWKRQRRTCIIYGRGSRPTCARKCLYNGRARYPARIYLSRPAIGRGAEKKKKTINRSTERVSIITENRFRFNKFFQKFLHRITYRRSVPSVYTTRFSRRSRRRFVSNTVQRGSVPTQTRSYTSSGTRKSA